MHHCSYYHNCQLEAPLFDYRTKPFFLKFLLILCYLLLCCPSEDVSFEVCTHFVQSDLHSRRCLFVLALCVWVFNFFFVGGRNFLIQFFSWVEDCKLFLFFSALAFVRLQKIKCACNVRWLFR